MHRVKDLDARSRRIASKTAGFVVEKLPEEFRRLYPLECARLAAHPEATLGELLPPPDESRWLTLLQPEPLAANLLDQRQLADFRERLLGFATLELEVLRGRRTPVSIHEHLAEFEPLLARFFARPAELQARIAEYGAAVIDAERGGTSDPERVELAILELCWEARCARENELLGQLPPDARFWLHLGRVLTRHVYDDSWWLAPDELAAAELGHPDWLAAPR